MLQNGSVKMLATDATMTGNSVANIGRHRGILAVFPAEIRQRRLWK